ncbi:hypothetical protein C6499_01820 [Candidatus Poribacteria bacterium]|nr:MAG: hypothetical protein C6499_01820 [Candidatus Poribacteria bacterium]
MTVQKGILLALVLIIASFGVYLRVQNLKLLEERYLVGSDPYRYFRQARLIIEEGKLPDVEMARNFPEGLNLAERSTLFPKLLAASYKGIHSIFPAHSLHHVLSLYPPISVGIALIFLFLIAHHLFGRFTALLTLLMLAALPIFMQRTLAGYIDTDPLIVLLLFAGIYFYLLSFQESFGILELVCAGIAGGILGMLSSIWPGGGMVLLIFCAFQLLISWEKDYTRADLYRFACWLLPIVLLILGFGTNYWKNSQSVFTVLALYVPLATFCAVVTIFFLQQSKRCVRFSQRFGLPVGLFVSLLLICASVLVLTLYSRDFSWIEGLIQRLRYPYGKNGVMEFVGELQPTTWKNWQKVYGTIGLTTIAGFSLVAYSYSSQNLWRSLIQAGLGGAGLLMIGLIGTVPEVEILDLFSIQSTLILLGNFCLFVSLASAAHFRYHKRLGIDPSISLSATPINGGKLHLILIVWFVITWNLGSAAVRFHLFLAPVAAILTCHFFSWLLQKTLPRFSRFQTQFLLGFIFLAWLMLINASDIFSLGLQVLTFGRIDISLSGRIQFLLTLLITAVLFGPILQEMLSGKGGSILIHRAVGAICVVLLIWLNLTGLYAFGSVERAVIWGARQGGPYPNKVVRTACEWLKENVPQNAVIAADWGIGSAINEVGRRTTIVDEEQNIPRILEMAQEFFCGTEDAARQFLEKYGVTHLLLSSDELGKLNIHSAALQPSAETSTVWFQPGPEYTPETWHYIPINESALPEFQSDDIRCQRSECSIESVSIPLTWENHLIVKTPPEVLIQRQNKTRQKLTVKEVIIGEQSWYFPEGQLNASIWCVGNMNKQSYHNYQTIYLSEAAREWFLVKLFLGEHSNRFKLVYESEASDKLQVKVWEVLR